MRWITQKRYRSLIRKRTLKIQIRFDEVQGTKPIIFIEKYCRHSKGEWAGKPIKLELWQKAFIQALYGFIDEYTGLRRFRKLVLFVARKMVSQP